MLSFLPSPIKGIFAATLFGLNTIFWSFPLFGIAMLRKLSPAERLKRFFSDALVRVAEYWIAVNNFGLNLIHKIHWDIRGLEGFRRDRSYLICANHQSWIDIVVLTYVFTGRVPLLRFLLKYELLYLPVIGTACWLLDFPFMKRYTKEYLEKHPEKRGQDYETIRRACSRFKDINVSILNFLEGTRFSRTKHIRQSSQYENLLKPKVGGISMVLAAMGQKFDKFIDVTIHYPEGAQNLWGLLSGKVSRVIVRIQSHDIPRELFEKASRSEEEFRELIRIWIQDIWENKDTLLSRLKSESA